MNRQDFFRWVENPSSLNQNTLLPLMQVAEKFPHSAILNALLCKNLHLTKNLEFDDVLRRTALLAPDRSKLYHLIHTENLQHQIRIINSALEEDLSAEQEVNAAQQQHATDINCSRNEIESEAFNILTAEANDEIIQQEAKGPSSSPDKKILDELEQNILSSAISSSIALEADTYETHVETSTEAPKPLPKIADLKNSKMNFSDWLKAGSSKMAEPDNAHVGQAPEKVQKRENTTLNLIDEFLKKKNEKKSENLGQSNYNPSEIARLSLLDNDEFVTETLASVYAKQENFDKAIKIYEQLMLKNPEKKTFFASRIRFLQEKKERNNK